MTRDEILMSLYRGRSIVTTEFDKYFEPNGKYKDTDMYICYVEKDGMIQFELNAYIKQNIVDHAETFKAYDTWGGHGRPVIEEHNLTSSEKKYAYEILDACFPDQAANEIDSVIDDAVLQQVEYEGYKISKTLSDGVQFLTPDGENGKILSKRILQALDLSHIDISILRDSEVASDFMGAFGKVPFQPLWAILRVVDATKYPNYKSLDNEYRYKKLCDAIENSNLGEFAIYEDLFAEYPDRIPQLCNLTVINNDAVTLRLLLDKTMNYDYDLSGCISRAVDKDYEDIFKILLGAVKSKGKQTEARVWNSAIYEAVKCPEREKYLLPLLQLGGNLSETLAADYFPRCSLDQIKDFLAYNVVADQKTVNRILDEKRWDIIELFETHPEKISNTQVLLITFINGKKFDKFADGLKNHYDISSKDLLKQAFNNGSEWSDLLLEYGYDINIDHGYLLHRACEDEDVEFVDYLLKHGADPYLKGEYSSTVMEKAAGFHVQGNYASQEKICRMLMKCGVDPIEQSISSPSCICYMNEFSTDFRIFLCDWLAEHGEINKPDCKDRKCPPHLPFYYIVGNLGIKYDEKIALHYLSNGTAVNARGITLDALFAEACNCASIQVLELMLQKGADINEEERFGSTGLQNAILNDGSFEKIKFLVDHGANVNDYTPSYISHQYGCGDKVHPAESILDIAEDKCTDEVVEFLKSAGAKHGPEIEAMK